MHLPLPFVALLSLLPLAQTLPSSSPFIGVDAILKRYGIASRSPEAYASQLPALRHNYPQPPNSSRLVLQPEYRARTPFDWASIALALHQEYIELDGFNYAIARFTPAEWEAWDINQNYVHLIRFFAQQEEGHSTAFANMLGPRAPLPCE
ncbi:hypothetical protein A4X09_0g6934, partial [Tilletia walkeri]